MCWEDVDIARKTATRVSNKNVTIAGIQYLQADPKRLSLTISGPVNNNLFVHFGDSGVAGQGFKIGVTQQLERFTYQVDGELVTLPVFMSIATAPENIEVTETYLRDEDRQSGRNIGD